MIVMWVILLFINDFIVEYNKFGFFLIMWVFGNIIRFVDGGLEYRVLYMYRVKLRGLILDEVYGVY